MMRKIKVLIVDDSPLYRQFITKGITTDPAIEVVATASDPFDARDKILKYEPDVITCDIEMPKMNGVEFIRRLLPQYPIPVVVVSTVSEAVLDAMDAGAVDFIVKPNVISSVSVEEFIEDIIIKIKIAALAKVKMIRQMPNQARPTLQAGFPQTTKVIAIGASTGGTEAIYDVIRRLPSSVPGIVIVQHIPPLFSSIFAHRLDATTAFRVKEAKTGDLVEPGSILVAPGSYHVRLKKIGDRLRVECFQGDKINGHCPSVDVMFESTAKEAGSAAIGVLLTGMGYDGAKGLLAMKRAGARTIGQDEATSVVYGMPKVAYNIGAVERQLALQNIPQVICSFLK